MMSTSRRHQASQRAESTASETGLPPDADRWVRDARAARGEGFDGLYRWLGGPVTAFARTRGATDPEGVTNEVFLKVFRSIGDFDGDALAFRAWIFTTARNHLIDEARKRARRPIVSSADTPEVAAPDTTVESALTALSNERVDALLSSLTETQREVIVLRIISDLSLAEVAAIVGRPETAVKRLQARALRRLEKKILAETVSP